MQPTETQPQALKPCIKCGQPRTASGRCKECAREYHRARYAADRERLLEQKLAWLAANKERKRETDRAWQSVNKERIQKNVRAWYAANKERIQEQGRAYYAANKERVRERHRAYYAANKERIQEQNRAWQAANPEAIRAIARASAHRRRATQLGTAVEKFTDIEIFERDSWRCHICKRRVQQTLKHPHQMSASLDHIVPLSKGGTHTRDNVACAHLKCNQVKHASMRGGVQPLLVG